MKDIDPSNTALHDKSVQLFHAKQWWMRDVSAYFFFNPKSPFIIVYNKQVLVVNKKLTFIATWIIMSAFILWIISDQLVDELETLCNE